MKSFEELEQLVIKQAAALMEKDERLEYENSRANRNADRCWLLEELLKEATGTDVHGVQTDTLREHMPECTRSKT